jgi:hypothetical protein
MTSNGNEFAEIQATNSASRDDRPRSREIHHLFGAASGHHGHLVCDSGG